MVENRSNYPDAEIAPEGVPNYLVCTPYYGGADLECVECVEALKRDYRALQVSRVHGCAYIDIARATAASWCLAGGFDGLFFIDHDIVFEPQEAVGLMRVAARTGAIAYALYSMRRSGHRSIGTIDLEGAESKRVKFFEGGGLQPGLYGGLGFAAIPRSVLELMGCDLPELDTNWSKCKALFALRAGVPDWEELYEALLARGLLDPECSESLGDLKRYFRDVVHSALGREYEGEDTSFFHRARRHGVRLICDTRPRIFHKGAYKYALEDVHVCVPRARSATIKFQPPTGAHGQPVRAAAPEQFEGLEDVRA